MKRMMRLPAICLALAALAVVSGPSGNIARGQQPATDQHTWDVYTNVRFEYKICYPADLLVPQAEAENSDGRKFLAKDGAQLIVYGQNNALNDTLKQRLEETGLRLTGKSGRVTYKVIKPNWFVISGLDEQTTFYSKTFYSHDQFKSFELTYSNSKSSIYTPVIRRLATCFADLSH